MLLGLLLLLSVCNRFILDATGEDCIAGVVSDLTIDSNANLTWTIHPTEPCQIDEFRVDVARSTTAQFRFYVKERYANLSFLDVCERWTYTVIPISGGITGHRRELTGYIPLPPDTDLTVHYFKAEKLAKGIVHLQWNLTDPIPGNCVSRLEYRLVIMDLQSGDVIDTYIRAQQTNLDLLSPCVPYELSIRAINTVEGPSRSLNVETDPYPEDPPTLSSIESTPTGINMVWTLESYLRNRCPVINFFVNGGNNFNITQPIRDHFRRAPVVLNVTQLQPDRMYYFKVSVENLGGVSPVVPMAAQTLKLEPGRD